MGKPSKYLAFPLASLGRDAAVTLKRARRDNPESRKKERIRVSIGVRKPNVYAIAEGATPNDTYPTVLALHNIITRNIGKGSTRSARESNSWPSNEDFPLHLATLPSKKSASNPAGRKARAFHRYVSSNGRERLYPKQLKIDMIPQNPFNMVTKSAICRFLSSTFASVHSPRVCGGRRGT